jgi:hypothetical protein
VFSRAFSCRNWRLPMNEHKIGKYDVGPAWRNSPRTQVVLSPHSTGVAWD